MSDSSCGSYVLTVSLFVESDGYLVALGLAFAGISTALGAPTLSTETTREKRGEA